MPLGKSAGKVLISVFSRLSPKLKKSILITIVFSLATTFCELISVALILPFLGALSQNTALIYPSRELSLFIRHLFGVNALPIHMLALLLIFTATASIAGMTVATLNNRLSRKVASELSSLVYKRLLLLQYSSVQSISQSLVSSIIITDVSELVRLFNALISIVPSASTTLCLLILTSLISPKFSAIILATIIATLLSYHLLSRKWLSGRSNYYSKASNDILSLIEKSVRLASARILSFPALWSLEEFEEANYRLRLSQTKADLYLVLPRYIIELVLAVATISVAYYFYLADPRQFSSSLPVIATFAIALWKLIPSAQRLIFASTQLRLRTSFLNSIETFLSEGELRLLKAEPNEPLPMSLAICVPPDMFSLEQHNSSIQDGKIVLREGEWIGLTGRTGVGKTYLVESLIGLRDSKVQIVSSKSSSHLSKTYPTHRYLTDSLKCSYVPVNPYLFNGSFIENVTLAKISDSDLDLFEQVSCITTLSNIYNCFPSGPMSLLDNDNIRLSAGQSQILSIARALYLKPDLLVLDETTNAMDVDLENRVIHSIRNSIPKLMVIFVSHRTSALRLLDRTYSLRRA